MAGYDTNLQHKRCPKCGDDRLSLLINLRYDSLGLIQVCTCKGCDRGFLVVNNGLYCLGENLVGGSHNG